MTGQGGGDYRIVPFRGDYYTFRPAAAGLVRGPGLPGARPGVPVPRRALHPGHRRDAARRPERGARAGPGGIRAAPVNGRDLLDSLRFPGLRKLARTYARTGALEIWRDLVKPAYLAEMRRYIPASAPGTSRSGPSGIRAQCLSRSGALVDDFLIEEGDGVIHVLNAPSPAATASIVIGRHIAERAVASFGL